MLLAGVFVILCPRLFAQAPGEKDVPLDDWRAHLSRELDRDLAELSASTATPASTHQARGVGASAFATPAPDSFRLMELGSSQPQRSTLASILRRQGLPASLAAVAEVESGFNPLALSPKGARGLWQLMPETARRFGLTVDGRRDERLDPRKSTLAAAQYLKVLFAQFHDWPLALAAYNSGEERVQRSLDRLGAHDFWTLSRHAALPEETRRYVPAVLSRLDWWPPSAQPSLDITLTPVELDQPLGPAGSPAPPAHTVFALTSPGAAGSQTNN